MGNWVAIGRHVGLASLAGVVSGLLVGGVLGRIVMRISGFAAGPTMVGVHTSNGNRVGDITFAGTLGLVLFVGLGAGLAGGVVYGVLEPWLRRLRPWHGLAYGSALLATFGFTVLDPSNFDFSRFGPLSLNIAMFGALFVTFGVSTAWLFDHLQALAARPGRIGHGVELAAWLALGLSLLFSALLIVGAAADDRLFALAIAGALVLAAIAHWQGLPRLVGYACLAAVLVLGTLRTFDSVQLFRGF